MRDLDILMELEERKRENQLFQYEPYPWQKDFHNNLSSEKMLIAANQCISPWTSIETPSGADPILEFLTSKEFDVQSWDGESRCVSQASGVFLKGIEPAYRFHLDNGQFFDCSHKHLLLSDGAWVSADQLVRASSGLRWTQTAQDYQESCGVGGHLYDEQPPLGQDTDLKSPPSKDDARKCGLIFSQKDAEARISQYNHAYQESGLPSNLHDPDQILALCESFQDPASQLSFLHTSGIHLVSQMLAHKLGLDLKDIEAALDEMTSDSSFHVSTLSHVSVNSSVDLSSLLRDVQQSVSQYNARQSSLKSQEDDDHIQIFYPFDIFLSGTKVLSIVPIGYTPIIDLKVKNTNCYFAAGVVHHNCGKTFSAAHEVAIHATGLYPEWWEGKRFHKPNLIWAASKTNEDCRDIAQVELLGGMENRQCLGTGAIPKHCLDKPKTRQAGIGDVVDYVDVLWHDDSGNPTDHKVRLQFKSYEQGWQKFQGRKVDVVWLDEEPDNFKIYSECVMRTINTAGVVLVTFTPLSGWTELVERFHSDEHDNYVLNVTWDDAKHLDKETKDSYLRKFPAHERDARSKGIPMLGEGRIFTTPEPDLLVDPFEIPKHWSRIIGIDFGIGDGGDPAGTALLAHDRDQDIVYLVNSSKRKIRRILEHTEIIRRMGGGLDTEKIPVAWPHDGLKSGGEDGRKVIQNYKKHRLSLLSRSARVDNDKGGSQSKWQSVEELVERMESGRFKVFSTNQDFMKEYRSYHQKVGKIVDYNDHIIDAVRTGLMMLRFARTKVQRTRANTGYSNAIVSSNI